MLNGIFNNSENSKEIQLKKKKKKNLKHFFLLFFLSGNTLYIYINKRKTRKTDQFNLEEIK